MLFTESYFLFFFLPAALAIQALGNRFGRGRPYGAVPRLTLFLLTLFFYGFRKPWWLAPFLVSVGFDFLWATLLVRTENPGWRKGWCACSVIQNTGLLVLFKYGDLLARITARVWPAGPPFLIPQFSLDGNTLPIAAGLSFYTFESMSFVIDVYRRDCFPPANPLTFFSFIAMFPRFVAGPILRYAPMEKQMLQYHGMKIETGLVFFFWGLFLKLGFADQFGILAQYALYVPAQAGFTSAWVGVLAFCFQIYFDFSGYSLMAIGLGKCLGFNFPENFRSPYCATSLRDFWQRWHITLSQWFRDYLYLPLGGNQKGPVRHSLNLLCTMVVAGAWHGPNLNFVIWGAWHGTFLCLEHAFRRRGVNPHPRYSAPLTFLIVVFGFAIFATNRVTDALALQRAMLGFGSSPSHFSGAGLRAYPISVALCLIGVGYCFGIEPRLRERPAKFYVSLPVRLIACAAGLLAILMGFSTKSVPFLYFQF